MTSEKVFRRVMDVNFFGGMRVTKAFLPLIRHAKGRVVFVSSVTGVLNLRRVFVLKTGIAGLGHTNVYAAVIMIYICCRLKMPTR